MYDFSTLKSIYDRIKAQYPQYEMCISENLLTITPLHGKVEITPKGAKLYANEKLYDQFSCDEVTDSDDLYELIELFLMQLREIGMESGNQTYIAANKKAVRWGTRALLAALVIHIGSLLALLLTKNLLYLLPALLAGIVGYLALCFARKKAFASYWICPQCRHPLPLDKSERFPKMEYVSKCPHCGCVLEKAPEMEPLNLDSDAPAKKLGPVDHLPAPGKKWPCLLTGGITIAIALLLLLALFAIKEEAAPIGIAVAATLIAVMLGLGVTLLTLRHAEPDEWHQPIVVIRERKIVANCGMMVWLLGVLSLFAAIICAGTTPFDGGIIFFLTLVGVPMTLLGVWMLLARRNRSMFVFRDNSIMYISSWGRVRHFEPGQLASVEITVNRSMHLLDRNGARLAAIETNMQGADRFMEWLESTNLTTKMTHSLEKQVVREAENNTVTQWREEYRTPLHDHLGAIRIGLFLLTLLFIAGNVVPYLLILYADLKMIHAIYMIAFSPLPLLLYYFAFSPVFLMGDYPAGVTKEWKSMHIKFPVLLFLIFGLLNVAQIYYFWAEQILQIVDIGRFLLTEIVLTAILILLFWKRTPKRMRTNDFSALILLLIALGFSMTYGFNLAISKPVEHYPAVVVERHGPTAEHEDTDPTLTVVLDDGSTMELNVSEQLYELEQAGAKLVVCQKENFLGIRIVRLHLPQGTNLPPESK